MTLKNRFILILVALFWCGITGAFDFFIFTAAYRQFQSYGYKEAPSKIVRSELKINHGEGTTYSADIEFTYVVNDRTYSSELYEFDQSSSSDSGWAKDAIAANPVGAARVCYYDPDEPSRAILNRGIHGGDVFMVMFITPFNVIGMAIVSMALPFWRNKGRTKPRFVDPYQNREGYCMNVWTPVSVLVSSFFTGTFFGTFAIALASGFHPSLTLVGIVWGGVTLAAIGLSIIVCVRNASGRHDLVIDHNSKTVSLPPMHGRPNRETVPFQDVAEFNAHKVIQKTGRDEKIEHFVNLVDTKGAEIRLKAEFGEDRAQALAQRLNEALGLRASRPDDEISKEPIC